MKLNVPQKPISLFTAALAAFTGIAFFILSLQSSLGIHPVPVLSEKYSNDKIITNNINSDQDTQYIYSIFQRLGNRKAMNMITYDSFDCKKTTLLQDLDGVMIGHWNLPQSVEHCNVFISSSRATFYTVIIEEKAHIFVTGEPLPPGSSPKKHGIRSINGFGKRFYKRLELLDARADYWQNFPLDCNAIRKLYNSEGIAVLNWNIYVDSMAHCLIEKYNDTFRLTIVGTPETNNTVFLKEEVKKGGS